MTGTARAVDVIRDRASEDVVDDGGKGKSKADTVGESMGMRTRGGWLVEHCADHAFEVVGSEAEAASSDKVLARGMELAVVVVVVVVVGMDGGHAELSTELGKAGAEMKPEQMVEDEGASGNVARRNRMQPMCVFVCQFSIPMAHAKLQKYVRGKNISVEINYIPNNILVEIYQHSCDCHIYQHLSV